MAFLTPGVVLKLLESMNSGTKPTNEHRNSVLQVMEIMPVDLDEKDLWPKNGFYAKVTDSSDSIYVSFPSDLILMNEIQLGQLVFVEKFDPGSPFPIAKGVKPIPGRQPFVKMPEPVNRSIVKNEKMNRKMDVNVDRISNLDSKTCTPRRGSWGTVQKGEQKHEHEHDVFNDLKFTPAKIRSAMNMNTNVKTFGSRRSSWVTGPKRDHGMFESPMGLKSNRRESLSKKLTETPKTVNKRCITSSMEKIPKGKSGITVKDSKTLTTPFDSVVGKECVTPPSLQSAKVVSSPYSSTKTSLSLHLPQNLSLIGKEAIQQQERAQKIALQALRNASATETLVCSLKGLSTLTKSANPDDPTDCFDQFLDFHTQLVQAITNMVSVKAATETTNKSQQKSTVLGKHSRSSLSSSHADPKGKMGISHADQKGKMGISHADQKGKMGISHADQKGKMGISHGGMNDTIQLGNQIEREAGNWFLEFVEECLEKGLKKSKSKSNGVKVPQLVVKKVMNWVEVEQCDSSKRKVHPKAGEIVRKLRIKLRNF